MKLWIVGKVTATLSIQDPDENIDSAAWEFSGVFDSEEKAVAECKDRRYFVGPVELNSPLPDERHEWPDSYYPSEAKPPQQTV